MMRRYAALVLLSIACVLECSAQSVVTKSTERFDSNYRPLVKDGAPHSAFRGAWRARGYGYVFRITSSEIKFFNETRSNLWESSDVDPVDLIATISDNLGCHRIVACGTCPRQSADHRIRVANRLGAYGPADRLMPEPGDAQHPRWFAWQGAKLLPLTPVPDRMGAQSR